MSFYDDELIEAAKKAEIALSPLDGLDDWVGILERHFPFRMGRIDWGVVSGMRHAKVADNDDCIAAFKVADELSAAGSLIYLGDSLTELVYEFNSVDLERLLHIVSDVPQHHFVFPPDAAWCINVTFEGDAYFGHAPR